MKQINISVNPAVRADKPMRNILGMNNHPRINFKPRFSRHREWFEELNVRYIRHHDAALENPSFELVDVSRIFPLFHLDENNPENYRFAQTDDYFSVVADMDLEIDFRLGETIDHSGFGRNIQPPKDAEKWARICRNIVAHYKDGLWNGMHLNVTRATVWEEPDNDVLFGGTVDEYSELFCAVSKLFKQEWPDIQVGGPTMCGGRYPFFDRFLAVCKENGVTPDYATVTQYARSLDTMPETIGKMRAMLDQYGFTQTKIIISEWHLGPTEWGENGHSKVQQNGFDAAMSAAYASASLARLMDIDYLDVAFYYAWSTGIWGVASFAGDFIGRYPVYFGLKFFNELAVGCKERLAVDWAGAENTEVLAGKTEDGKVRLMVSCYETEQSAFTCKVEGAVACSMKAVQSDYAETDATEEKALEVSADGSVSFSQAAGGSDVFLLEFSF